MPGITLKLGYLGIFGDIANSMPRKKSLLPVFGGFCAQHAAPIHNGYTARGGTQVRGFPFLYIAFNNSITKMSDIVEAAMLEHILKNKYTPSGKPNKAGVQKRTKSSRRSRIDEAMEKAMRFMMRYARGIVPRDTGYLMRSWWIGRAHGPLVSSTVEGQGGMPAGIGTSGDGRSMTAGVSSREGPVSVTVFGGQSGYKDRSPPSGGVGLGATEGGPGDQRSGGAPVGTATVRDSSGKSQPNPGIVVQKNKNHGKNFPECGRPGDAERAKRKQDAIDKKIADEHTAIIKKSSSKKLSETAGKAQAGTNKRSARDALRERMNKKKDGG